MPRRRTDLLSVLLDSALDTVRAEAGGSLMAFMTACGCTEEEVVRLFVTNDIRTELVDIATPRLQAVAGELLKRTDLSPAAREALNRITVGTAAEFAKRVGRPTPRKS